MKEGKRRIKIMINYGRKRPKNKCEDIMKKKKDERETKGGEEEEEDGGGRRRKKYKAN